MSAIPSSITDFIKAQTAATVCCLAQNAAPYAFNCYYAFEEKKGWLIYKSGFSTAHEEMLKKDARVAGTIIPEQIILATLQGIQYQGAQLPDSLEISMQAASVYYLKYPFAMAVPGKIFAIRLDTIKFTDNARGFGHKENWQREEIK